MLKQPTVFGRPSAGRKEPPVTCLAGLGRVLGVEGLTTREDCQNSALRLFVCQEGTANRVNRESEKLAFSSKLRRSR